MSKLLRVPNVQQPEFPHVDLPEGAEGWLAVALQSRPNFAMFHQASDEYNKLYHMTHLGLASRSQQELDDVERSRAFVLGVMLFESIGGIIRQTDYDINLISRLMSECEDPDAVLVEEATIATAEQLRQTPRLAEVIGETASVYLNGDQALVSYALGGSAVMRSVQLEADALRAA